MGTEVPPKTLHRKFLGSRSASLQVGQILATLLGLSGCEKQSESDHSEPFNRGTPSVCVVTYATPKNFSVDIGETPFTTNSETFCGWEKGAFRTSFTSNLDCAAGATLRQFEVLKVERFDLLEAENKCLSAEVYDLRENPALSSTPRQDAEVRLRELRSDHTYTSALVDYSTANSMEVVFQLGFANQREGYPIKAYFLNDDSADIFFDNRFSPWNEETCLSLRDRIQAKSPEKMTWTCQ